MQARRYKHEDLAEIKRWALEGYGYIYSEHQFPKIGFIVDGVAAYFLYQTDSTVCFLENLVANKKIDKDQRSQAIDLIIKELLKTASELGFRVAYATTNLPQVVTRAIRFNAQVDNNQFLITKNLTDLSL